MYLLLQVRQSELQVQLCLLRFFSAVLVSCKILKI